MESMNQSKFESRVVKNAPTVQPSSGKTSQGSTQSAETRAHPSTTNKLRLYFRQHPPTLEIGNGKIISRVRSYIQHRRKPRTMAERIIHYYRKTEPSHSLLPSCKEQLKSVGLAEDSEKIANVETESCFNVQMTSELTDVQTGRLEWLLAETFEKGNLHLEKSAFDLEPPSSPEVWQVEFGPRMTFTSAFSSNAVSICKGCELPIDRLEVSRRYRFALSSALSPAAVTVIKALLHDRMTEEEYLQTLTTFDNGAKAEPVRTVPIMEQGRSALEKINEEKGLGFDDFDLDYYTTLFKVSTQNEGLNSPGSFCQPPYLHHDLLLGETR
jgi:hypothetical protein